MLQKVFKQSKSNLYKVVTPESKSAKAINYKNVLKIVALFTFFVVWIGTTATMSSSIYLTKAMSSIAILLLVGLINFGAIRNKLIK